MRCRKQSPSKTQQSNVTRPKNKTLFKKRLLAWFFPQGELFTKKQSQRNNGTTLFSRCFRRFAVVPIFILVGRFCNDNTCRAVGTFDRF